MGQASVLIVEDDAHISGIVAEHLGRAGYACTQAFSGTEARLVLDGARQRGERFDVVVCDLMLPGLSGEDIVRLIRAADADTPIVVTSARSAASDKMCIRDRSTSLPVPSCAQMRQPRSWSTTTVTYVWPFLYDVSSMPRRRTPSNLEAPRAASSSA